MQQRELQNIFKSLGFIRTGGSKEELKAAEIIKDIIEKIGVKAELEPFEVDGDTASGKLLVGQKEIACKAYRGSKSVKKLTAPLHYLSNTDPYSLSECKGKIVLFLGGLGRFRLEDLVKNGAVGFIGTNGTLQESDYDIDDKELRSYITEGLDILPGVNINTKDAAKIIDLDPKEVTISVTNKKAKATSHNVVAYIKGEVEDEIVITAHYDSTPLSKGFYDNLSGTVAIISILEKMARRPHHHSLRFIFCGSEERGLLGSKAYVKDHADELEKMKLCINLDMVGTTLGHLCAVCTSEEKLCHYLEYRAMMNGVSLNASQGVYSSDSTPFADAGVPAVSFARIMPNDGLVIHNRYDQYRLISLAHMQEDIDYIGDLIRDLANAKFIPVIKEIPDAIKEDIDRYFARKRDKKIK